MSMLLSLLVLALGNAVAGAEVEPIIGTITSMRGDGGLLVKPLNGGQTVQVNVGSDTVYGATWTVGEGDVVIVRYDGRMTRSLPGQVMAQSVHSYSLEGMVVEVNEEASRVLLRTQEVGDVWLTLPDGESAARFANESVRAYTQGVMALSYPAQTSALAIATIAMEEGTVTDVRDDQFTIDWKESRLIVHYNEHTKVTAPFAAGDTVQVFYSGVMAMSMPGQITANVVAKAEG